MLSIERHLSQICFTISLLFIELGKGWVAHVELINPSTPSTPIAFEVIDKCSPGFIRVFVTALFNCPATWALGLHE